MVYIRELRCTYMTLGRLHTIRNVLLC